MEERQPRKLAVILHADVVGSTALVQRNESLAHARIQDAFHRFSSTIEAYNGVTHELRGDALVAEFARASDAVAAGLAFQIENTEANARLEDDLQPRLRIGISLGEVVIADNTVTGAGVVLAQRVEQLAEPGGVCITGAIHEAVPQHLPFDYSDLGKREAKGFAEPVQVYSASLKAGKQVPSPEPADSVGAQSRKPKRLWTASAIALLILVGGALAWWQPWIPEFETASMERMAFPLPDKPSIAVLPFDNLGGDPEQEILSDGLTNDIITDLSKFKHLFVIASNSTFSYKNKAVKVQQVAEELGVRYVLEGSFQKAGERLRINAQLIDATTGHHLWAERYDRNASDFFAIQDNILRTIVGSLASQVTEAEITRVASKGTEDLRAYDYYWQGRQTFRGYTKEANNQALELLDNAIQLDPDYARAYAFLTWVHANNSSGRYRWGKDPERSLELVLQVAQKAVELDPDDYHTHWAFGYAQIFHGNFDRAEAGYERALALNPSDAALLYNMAELLYKTGKAEQAIAQVKLAMRINPRHPEWYFWDLGLSQYFARQYQEALDTLNKMSNPPNGVRRTLAAVLVRLGRIEEAREVISKFIETDLDMTLEEMEAFAWKDREGLGRWIADLRVAGLPEKRPLPLPDKPSIAVLPFTNMSDDPKQDYFTDGMTEDLITDLSKISGLFVIARNSSFTYKGKAVDVKHVSRELGVKYILEGSVRRAGDQVRINAQLIDATTGGHLWAERYDGRTKNVFSLQDEITSKIVSALAVQLTANEEAEQIQRQTNNPQAYDSFLKGWEHYRRDTTDHYAKAMEYFQQAVDLDPEYSRAYAAMASIYWKSFTDEFYQVFRIERTEARERGQQLLKQALRNPSSLAYEAASDISLWWHKYDEAISNGEKAIALDPNSAGGRVVLANALIFSGRPKEALDLMNRAEQLDPLGKARYEFVRGLALFGMEQYGKAAESLERARELNPQDWDSHDPGETVCHPCMALLSTYGHLGRTDDADSVLAYIRAFWPAYSISYTAQEWPYKEAEDAERLDKGLRKAGLPE